MKTMDKKLLIVMFAMLLLIIPTAIAADGDLQATLSRYEPLPAQPGQYVTIYVQLENIGNEDAPNAYLEIIDSFPFSIVTESERSINIGVIKSQKSYVADFKLRVDSNAVVGLNKVKIKYTTDKDSNNWKEKELSVEVKPSEAKLAVNKVEVMPEQIHSGEDGVVTITVKNSASIVFRDVSVKLDFNEDDIPFIPLNSITEKQIALLKPGELSQISFPLSVYPTATPGYYKVPLEISFYDDEGTEQTQSDIIGLIVSAAPELKVIYDSYELTPQGYWDVRLKTINKGVNDLKFLDLEVLGSDDYKLVASKEYYVGDLDSDDYRTADFELTSDKKEFTLATKATFRDENNKLYTQNINVPVKITNGSSSNGGSGWITFLLILIIVVLGYYIYRSKKKPKHK